MAIEPAVVNLPTIYQNAAYNVQLRLTDRLRPATIAADGLVHCVCHGLAVSAKVVLLSKTPSVRLCGAVLNHVYFISPLDFTPTTFRLTTAATSGNILDIADAGDQTFYIAQPVDITGYTIDADICKKLSNIRVEVGSFTTAIKAAIDGAFSLNMDPPESVAIAAGVYSYDVSMTPPNEERFYAIRGDVPVAVTRSRT